MPNRNVSRKPKEWRDRFEHGHGGPGGGPIPVATMNMTQEEFRAMAADIAQKV